MTSKKPFKSKRASIPRASGYTKKFIKDWERLDKSGRYDMNRLSDVMLLIVANKAPLPAELSDHKLSGNWDGHRECHIGGDFLLVYNLDEAKNAVIFSRCGTHAEIFD